jgi:hypothetical protein
VTSFVSNPVGANFVQLRQQNIMLLFGFPPMPQMMLLRLLTESLVLVRL